MNWTDEGLLSGADEPEELHLEAVADELEDEDISGVQLDLLGEVFPSFEDDKVVFEPPELDEVLTALGGAEWNAKLRLLAVLHLGLLQLPLLHHQLLDVRREDDRLKIIMLHLQEETLGNDTIRTVSQLWCTTHAPFPFELLVLHLLHRQGQTWHMRPCHILVDDAVS